MEEVTYSQTSWNHDDHDDDDEENDEENNAEISSHNSSYNNNYNNNSTLPYIYHNMAMAMPSRDIREKQNEGEKLSIVFNNQNTYTHIMIEGIRERGREKEGEDDEEYTKYQVDANNYHKYKPCQHNKLI